jgi:hypothetical protein
MIKNSPFVTSIIYLQLEKYIFINFSAVVLEEETAIKTIFPINNLNSVQYFFIKINGLSTFSIDYYYNINNYFSPNIKSTTMHCWRYQENRQNIREITHYWKFWSKISGKQRKRSESILQVSFQIILIIKINMISKNFSLKKKITINSTVKFSLNFETNEKKTLMNQNLSELVKYHSILVFIRKHLSSKLTLFYCKIDGRKCALNQIFFSH